MYFSTQETYIENSNCIVHSKGNIANSVPVFGNVRVHFFIIRFKWRLKNKENLVLTHDMRNNLSATRFQSAISNSFESKASAIIRSGLLSIPDPKDEMVKSKVFTDFRFNSFISVAGLKNRVSIQLQSLTSLVYHSRLCDLTLANFQ